MVLQSSWFKHPCFSDINTGKRILSAGATGEPVRMLQAALIELGYALPGSIKKSGKLDGVFGNETDKRVREFQKFAFPGTNPDGIVGWRTLGALDSRLISKQPPSHGDSPIWGRAPASIPGSPEQSLLGRHFNGMVAIRQMHDMACWAACLCFWSQMMKGGRPRLNQARLNQLYFNLSQTTPGPKMGGMPTGGLKKIIQGDISPEASSAEEKNMNWKANMRDPFFASFTVDWLKTNTSYGRSIILGYTINGASHINVVGYYEMDVDDPYVWVMEPWEGAFFLRRIEYYQSSSRTFIIQESFLP